jgi:hypothetical protein
MRLLKTELGGAVANPQPDIARKLFVAARDLVHELDPTRAIRLLGRINRCRHGDEGVFIGGRPFSGGQVDKSGRRAKPESIYAVSVYCGEQRANSVVFVVNKRGLAAI